MKTPLRTMIPALLLACTQAATASTAVNGPDVLQDADINELNRAVGRFTDTTSTLDAAQRATLDQYVRAMMERLGSEDHEDVMRARDGFVETLTGFGTTDVFRQAFAEAFLKESETILKGDDQFNRINAYRVLGAICTTESNEVLVDQLRQDRGASDADRVMAANMLTMALRKTGASQYRTNMRGYLSIITSILNSALKERNWVALVRQFECLAGIATDSRLGPENQENELRGRAIQAQAMILEGTLNQIETGGDLELARAVPAMVLMLRSEYIKLDRLRKQKFAATLVPKLVMVLETGGSAWDRLQSREEIRDLYADAVFQSAVLTRLVRGSGGAPGSNPDEAWRTGNRAGYETQVRAWAASKNP